MSRGAARSLLFAVGLVATALPAQAQSWAADLYAGGAQQTALAERAADVNLVGNIRYAGRDDAFLYLSGATPLNADAVEWAAAGLGRRLAWRPGLGGGRAGLDVAGHAYAYGGGSAPGGRGGTVHVLPYVGWDTGATSVEVRGGRSEHRFRHDGESYGRGLYEVEVRGGATRGTYAAQLSGRWLADDSTSYPFAGIQLAASVGPARVWGGAGRWMVAGDESTEWSAGAAVEIGTLGQAWAGVRADARDPLYQTGDRTSWNVGFSRPLGRRPGMTILPAPRVSEGGVVFRLPRAAVPPAAAGDAPAVAGEFSDWQPLPMRPGGDAWMLELPMKPGVYRFSFVSAAGEWFVPEGYPGRTDDGMGGWVVVLVVP